MKKKKKGTRITISRVRTKDCWLPRDPWATRWWTKDSESRFGRSEWGEKGFRFDSLFVFLCLVSRLADWLRGVLFILRVENTLPKAAARPVTKLASSTWVRGGIIPDIVTKIEEAWNAYCSDLGPLWRYKIASKLAHARCIYLLVTN